MSYQQQPPQHWPDPGPRFDAQTRKDFRLFAIIMAALVVVVVGAMIGMDGDGGEGEAARAASSASSKASREAEQEQREQEESQRQQAADNLAAAVQDSIDSQTEAADYIPTWAYPITGIEGLTSKSIRVHYQEALTDEEAEDVARAVTSFTMNSDGTEDLDTVVVRDTSGVDRNFYRRDMGF